MPSKRVIVISGGARGQGLSHARAFASLGDHVAVLDSPKNLLSVPYSVSSDAELNSAHRELEQLGTGSILSYSVDVRNADEVEKAAGDVADRLGGIDIAIANAGVFSFARTTWEIDPAAWRECCDSILFGSFSLVRACVPHMIGRTGANVVFIGSVSAHKGIASTGHYVAAKHGVVGLMRTLAIELAPYGMRSNMVSPTATRTIMATNLAMAECVEFQERSGSNMSNLLGVDLLDPQDVTEAVLWVSSSSARYVTGDVIKVDAGFTTR